ncbi:membrane protein YfcA [Alcanivorax sp. 521-1]|uniref:Probable membrane transporter protein n=1 Tax=Alloalcanivorax profundimaris TaxID=2735259 RepID=A0ABS0AS71_9GAMM|nr:TSUP family transporter [Alloalcanivorax profundimaris]MBF5056983.1 membrane protein YfcA [Alloalcanivorax profundimaris]
MELELTTLLMLAGLALLAGFIDTLAGGGGLLTLPGLLLAGLPPVQALAANKLQGTFGSGMATFTLLRLRRFSPAAVRRPFLWALVGSAAGTVLVQVVHTDALEILVPVVLAIIALYFLLTPGAGRVERAPRLGAALYERTVVPAIGFYDGFFGPGTGSFFSLAEVALRGRELITATAHAKAFNFASNIASLVLFVIGGKVLWLVGGTMILGQLTGAWLGAHAVLRGGQRLIRPLIVLMCLAMIGRYLYATVAG